MIPKKMTPKTIGLTTLPKSSPKRNHVLLKGARRRGEKQAAIPVTQLRPKNAPETTGDPFQKNHVAATAKTAVNNMPKRRFEGIFGWLSEVSMRGIYIKKAKIANFIQVFQPET